MTRACSSTATCSVARPASRDTNRGRGFLATRHSRPGFVLIVVMVVLFAVASLVLALARTSRTELDASNNQVSSLQATAIERGAEQYVTAIVTEQLTDVPTLNGDGSTFEHVQVGNGYFWVVRPDYLDADLPLYGIVDESSKLNLNVVTEDQLALIANMDEDVAGSIIDWRDEDDDPTNGGAESNQYLADPVAPHNAKNAPYESVDEMLMVQGVTPQLFYGDAVPAQPVTSGGASSASGGQKTGISQLPAQPSLGLSSGSNSMSSSSGSVIGGEALAHAGWGAFFTVWNKTTPAAGGGGGTATGSTSSTSVDSPLINVNQAPREVLLCIPNIEEADVDKLLSARVSGTQDDPTSTTWVQDALGHAVPGITGQGKQFSADIVAVSGDGRSFKRVRIVIDTLQTPPQIVYRRDVTDMGLPQDQTIRDFVDSLKHGKGAPQ